MIEHVLDALRTVEDPDTGRNIVRLGLIRDLRVQAGTVAFTLVLRDPTRPFAADVEQLCRDAIAEQVDGDLTVRISMDNEMIGLGDELSVDGKSQAPAVGEGVINIVAVASGKGGVGKSTVAANLAVSLASNGYDVGLVDCDIYGPSIPTMFGVEDAKPRVNEKRHIEPIEKFGVKLLSMGFLVDQEKAVIWRGPMVTSAIRQFLGECEWGELDYLILDLPPGTGDIQLTIVQTIPLTGAVVVSTPQRVALADARKGVAMFEQVNVPVLGIVENMAWFTPPDLPDRKYWLFGKGGARRLAEQLDVPLIGELPIREAIRETSDAGTPIASHGDDPSAEAFADLARRVVDRTEFRNATRPSTQQTEILHR
ncbi:MAG: Mrp/NBP35 family ATP-binding protein [Rhodothermales bacterium]|nr:Mrp/NBP35 family ATP-binding protein [Rhodothermales bacterium]